MTTRTCSVRPHIRQLSRHDVSTDPLVMAYEMALRLVCIDAVEEALADFVREYHAANN